MQWDNTGAQCRCHDGGAAGTSRGVAPGSLGIICRMWAAAGLGWWCHCQQNLNGAAEALGVAACLHGNRVDGGRRVWGAAHVHVAPGLTLQGPHQHSHSAQNWPQGRP